MFAVLASSCLYRHLTSSAMALTIGAWPAGCALVQGASDDGLRLVLR